jgi:hypothetical protein
MDSCLFASRFSLLAPAFSRLAGGNLSKTGERCTGCEQYALELETEGLAMLSVQSASLYDEWWQRESMWLFSKGTVCGHDGRV